MYARVYPDAEEAELGVAESGARSPDQRNRSDDLHSRRGTQPAGALDCADPRGPREGFAGCALSRGAWNAGRDGSRGTQPGPFEIRDETSEKGLRTVAGGQ